jgi:hypothetical protein
MKKPQAFAEILWNKYSFKLKGTGELSFNLGCDFYRDKDEVLCMAPTKYIKRMADNFARIFGEKPKQTVMSPLEKGNHPELNDTPLLDAEGIQSYQSIIGSAKWAISLGRLNIQTVIMTLSSFRSAPRIGHLDRAKCIVRYLVKFKHSAIKFRVKIPDHSDLPDHNFGWDTSIYEGVSAILPDDAPRPLRLPVLFTRYVDANLFHDWITRRSVTGVISIVNQTPLEWISKKQPMVKTATYRSEFVTTRLAKDFMFGDNESAVNSST